MKQSIGCLIIIIALAIYLAPSCFRDSSRNRELAKTKDPSRLVYLLLDYIAADAKSSVSKDVNGNITIRFRIDPWALTAGTAKTQFLNHTKEIVPLIFERVTDARSIHLIASGELVDVRGNETRNDVLKIQFSKSTARSILWDNVNLDSLPQISDAYWEHPSFKK